MFFFTNSAVFLSQKPLIIFSHFFTVFIIISVVGTVVQPRLMRHWSLFSQCKELGWNSRFLALLAFRSEPVDGLKNWRDKKYCGGHNLPPWLR